MIKPPKIPIFTLRKYMYTHVLYMYMYNIVFHCKVQRFHCTCTCTYSDEVGDGSTDYLHWLCDVSD